MDARWRMYLTTSLMGLVVVSILGYSFQTGIRMTTKYAPLIDAAMEIKLNATTAHLWLEEIVSGDRNKDLATVWQHLDLADWYAMAMLEGGENREERFIPLEDADLRRKITAVREKLAEFRSVSRERLLERKASVAGTAIDQRYDSIFEGLVDQADDVEIGLRHLMLGDLSRFRTTQITLIAVGMFFTFLVGIVLRRYQKRQAQDFDKIGEVNESLQKEVGERKQAEDELQKSERRLRTIIETEPECVKILSPDGHILEMNPAGISMIEAESIEQVRGKKVYPFIVPEFRAAFREMTERVCHGSSEVLAFEMIGLKGTRRWLETHAVPLRDAQNQIIGLLGVTRDITERKKAEAEIRKLNLELEERVSERTAELEAVNKELETFSYSVSHDLRAPLRAIDGFSHALLEDCHEQLNEVGQGHIDRIRNASQRMEQLIQDTLNLAYITRSKMRQRQVNLSTMAEEVAEELKKTTPRRKVEFVIQPDMEVKGDAGLLRIFLDNLLGNAWKFSGKKPHAKIEFGVQQSNAKKTYFVRDNGAGFDMAYADKLFDPFQRQHNKQEFKGTGIGLATAQRIIHRHGGKIWAEAAPDKGATFYFTLN